MYKVDDLLKALKSPPTRLEEMKDKLEVEELTIIIRGVKTKISDLSNIDLTKGIWELSESKSNNLLLSAVLRADSNNLLLSALETEARNRERLLKTGKHV